jgi:PAS domain S-box-containing protein
MDKQAILAAIIDSSEDAIISKTLEGYITSWNSAAEHMFGYREDEAIGKHISILIPKDRLAEEDMIINNIRNGRRVQHFQTIRVRKDGSTLPISLTISPVKNADGTIVGASKIARDISVQVRAEQETQKHLRNLEYLLSVGHTLSEKLELHSILQKLTDITTRLTGAEFGAFFYNRSDGNGGSYMLFTLSGAPREAFDGYSVPRNTPLFSKTFNGEGIFRSDDIRQDPRYGKNPPYRGMPPGHLPVVSYLAVPVKSTIGEVIGGLFFGHSLPGMFTAEHERLLEGIAPQAAVAIDNAKLYEEIKTLSSLKDEFIGVAGHELRTPITTIKGYLQLLEEEAPHGLTKDFIEKALRQVNKLSRLVSDLLDVTRIHAGKLDYTVKRTSLTQLVKESIETVWQINTSHIIESRLPEQEVFVMADATKIEQVLINFLTNAIKYSPRASKIYLEVATRPDTPGYAVVSVRDCGIGIPKQHLQNIFHRYYRVNQPQHTISGLGIGLYISKEIIERHNGYIWAESKEGEGSTFYFSLPLA